jgi:hypothetical protein
MKKPLVYVASPYTQGDKGINTHFQCMMFDRMLSDGLVNPFVPLWSHFQHLLFPRPYEDWLSYDLDIILKCDALLRLTAEFSNDNIIDYNQYYSPGADREVAHADSNDIPVFYSVYDLYNWVREIYNA